MPSQKYQETSTSRKIRGGKVAKIARILWQGLFQPMGSTRSEASADTSLCWWISHCGAWLQTGWAQKSSRLVLARLRTRAVEHLCECATHSSCTCAHQVPTKCPPPPSPKLESIGRPRRASRPLYILMSSISSHWTIPAPLTLRNFISLGQSDQRYLYHADC